MNINWNYPKVREGFWGNIDKLIGPGATKAEKRIQLYIPVIAGVAAIGFSREVSSSWGIGQLILLFLLTIDIVGALLPMQLLALSDGFTVKGKELDNISHLLPCTSCSYHWLLACFYKETGCG